MTEITKLIMNTNNPANRDQPFSYFKPVDFSNQLWELVNEREPFGEFEFVKKQISMKHERTMLKNSRFSVRQNSI
jgi:hypothetical protein